MTDFEPMVFLRDNMVPASQAKISFYDLGLIMGATITDLARTYRHKPFRLEDHLVRFYESCKYARIQPKISREQTHQISLDLIQHNSQALRPEDDLAIVYFITPGENLIYAGAAS